MKTKHICPTISIAIPGGGVDFLSNLIIIDSYGIDIIPWHGLVEEV
jgi:hypothetical protein